MKKCPREKIIESVTKITKHGLKHQYLALLSSITYCGEKNIVDNQFDVVKSLTHPSVIQKVIKFLCPVNDEEYKLKQEMMVPYLDERNLKLEDLPDDLAYHIKLIEVLSGCTVGRLNITSIEAKVQSIFGFYDILQVVQPPPPDHPTLY